MKYNNFSTLISLKKIYKIFFYHDMIKNLEKKNDQTCRLNSALLIIPMILFQRKFNYEEIDFEPSL